MPLRNIFKRRREEEKKIEAKAKETTPEIGIPTEVELPKVKKEIKIGEAWKILKTPQITEKATTLAKENQYIFKVYPEANKVEIKKAIEDLYGVDVMSVRIVKIPKKRRRLGKISGWRKGYKKAIVKIKEGQKIEVLPR